MKGLSDRVQKANWTKTDDGKYAILDIPIFSLVDDELKGVKFTIDKAKRAIQQFLEDAKRGFFPRVFVGHHDSTSEEKKGVGFLEGLKLKGDTIFANVVDINEENWTLFKNGVYPYRSVEYNSGRNLITGLALLESHMPYFRFANLVLNENPVLNFSMDTKIIRRFYMPDDIEKKEPAVAEEPAKMQEEPKQEAAPAWAIEIKNLLTQLVAMEMEEKKAREGQYAETPAPVAQVGKQPGSVAMQLDEVGKLKAEISRMKSEKIYSDRLTNFCDEHGADFAVHSNILQKFSSDSDRDAYLSMLENSAFSLNAHKMTGLANGYKNVPQDEVSKMAAKHGNLKLVKKAVQVYNDTMSHPDRNVVKCFQASFKDVSSFVDNVVDGTKSDPEYLDKLTLSE